jgi:glycosyltransferase involved in cell wall biosynthesis
MKLPASDNDHLSIVFPLWNEEALVSHTVATATCICDELVSERLVRDYEIVLVDDGSTDATGAIADELSEAVERVRVVHHRVNEGLGGSIRTGLAHARGTVVLYTDADLPGDLSELRRAFRYMRMYQADLISAYRHDRTAEGPRRAIYSWVYNSLIRVFFRVRVRDVNFAFKLMRRELVDQLVLRSKSVFIDAELVVNAHRLGYRIMQFGIDYFPRTRGVSTLSSLREVWKTVREMIAFGVRREPKHRGHHSRAAGGAASPPP